MNTHTRESTTCDQSIMNKQWIWIFPFYRMFDKRQTQWLLQWVFPSVSSALSSVTNLD
jgi:hypothetical protein